ASQPAQSGCWIDDGQWSIGEAVWIACHDNLAAARFGCGGADRVFEIPPCERECAPHHGLVHGSNSKHADQAFHAFPSECCAASLFEQIENRCYAVSWN